MVKPVKSLQLFRTLWGLVKEDGGLHSLHTLLPRLQRQGYTGIECSVQLAHRLPGFAQAMTQHGLMWAPTVFTCGPIDGTSPFLPGAPIAGPGCSWTKQLAAWTAQMREIETVGIAPKLIAFVNAFTGHDSMHMDDALHLFDAMAAAAPGLCAAPLLHETHRGCVLFSPWAARTLIAALPNTRLVADLSHWTCVTERNPPLPACDPGADALNRDMLTETITELAPAVQHVQGRVGSSQGPQVTDPRATEHWPLLEGFEVWWDTIWGHQLARDERCSFAPEQGPPPYQLLRYSGETYESALSHAEEVNDWLAQRELARFETLARMRHT